MENYIEYLVRTRLDEYENQLKHSKNPTKNKDLRIRINELKTIIHAAKEYNLDD